LEKQSTLRSFATEVEIAEITMRRTRRSAAVSCFLFRLPLSALRSDPFTSAPSRITSPSTAPPFPSATPTPPRNRPGSYTSRPRRRIPLPHPANRLAGSRFGWFCSAFARWVLDVGCWMLGVPHKRSEYNPPLRPPSGWSGGALVPPWYHPIPIERPRSPLFNQASLSRAPKPMAESAARRRKRRSAAKPQPKPNQR
jgi:hypothetical protein